MISQRPEDISETVGLIYETAMSQGDWLPLLERLRLLLNGSRACIARWSGSPDYDFVATGEHNIQIDPTETFSDYFGSAYGQAFDRLPVGAIFRDHRLAGKDALRSMPMWVEWMAPRDMYDGIGIKLEMCFLDIQRGRRQDAFVDSDEDLMRSLAPHFVRAGVISKRLAAAAAIDSGASSQAAATIVTDGNLRVVAQNEAADALLSDSQLFGVANGVLRLKGAREHALLKEMVENACQSRDGVITGTGGDMLVSGRNGLDTGGLVISVAPTAMPSSLLPRTTSRAVIAMRRIAPGGSRDSELFFRSSFNLTPAESRLCVALASGTSLSEAAIAQGLRVSTLRSHLDNVFRKTGTRRQGQLVALLKSAEPPPRSHA